MRSWRVWLTIGVVVVLAGAGVLALRMRNGTSEAASFTQVITVERGNLVAAITPTGEVYAPRQVDLSFDVNKTRLIELNVAPGQKVKASEVLARIDPTALERAVLQAEADLTVAEDNLEKARNPYSELDLSQAKLAVDQARVSLQEAQEKLQETGNPATELELTEAKLSVDQAKTALEEGREKLQEAQASATELELTEARVAVDQAKTSLEEAKENLETVKAGPTGAQLATAEAALKTAEDKYQELLAGPDPESLQRAKLQLDQARNSLWSAQMSRDSTCGAKERTGSSCDSAKVGVLNAEIRVQIAEMDYQDAQQPATDTELAEAAAQVERAKDDLEELRDSPTSLEIATAETQVSQAEYNLAKAEDRLAELEAGPDALEIATAETQVSQAEYNLAKAQENLAELEAGPEDLELAQAQTQVTQAEYNLAKAKENLAEIEAGPDPKEIEVAEAKVVSAQATLEEAQAALEAATMTAPFDGTVISVGAEVDDLVSSNAIVVTLADLSDLRVRAIVDETDISQVEIGQQVEITFDAFPGRKLRGEVLEVPLQGHLAQNILTYEVPVSLEGATGVSLKPGMTANLRMVVGRRENALLVPALAVQQGEEGPMVMVQDTPQGPGVATRVEVGLSDGVYIEVVRGLNEGDQVVIEYQPPQEGAGGFFGFGRMMGGGQRSRP